MKWNIEQRKSPRMHLRKIYLKKLNINYQCNIGIEIFLGGAKSHGLQDLSSTTRD